MSGPFGGSWAWLRNWLWRQAAEFPQVQDYYNVNPDGSRRPPSPLPEHHYFWNGTEWERFPQHVIDNFESINYEITGVGSGKKADIPDNDRQRTVTATAGRSQIPVIAVALVALLIFTSK